VERNNPQKAEVKKMEEEVEIRGQKKTLTIEKVREESYSENGCDIPACSRYLLRAIDGVEYQGECRVDFEGQYLRLRTWNAEQYVKRTKEIKASHNYSDDAPDAWLESIGKFEE
jgi:hypothetical protein